MFFWAKEKVVVVWDFKGEEDSSQGDGLSKCLVNICLASLRSLSHIKQIFFGDGSLPGVGFLSNFFFQIIF